MRTFLFMAPDAAFPMVIPFKDEESAPDVWDQVVPGPPVWMTPSKGEVCEPEKRVRFVKTTAVRQDGVGGLQAMVVYVEQGYHPHVSKIWQAFDMLPHEIRGGVNG